MLATNGFLAHRLVFGSNPANNLGWGDDDGDLLSAQASSLSGQFVAQWRLQMMAQEAALRGIANSRLHRSLPFNKSCDSVDVRVGDEVLFYNAPFRGSSSRRLGPAKVLLLGGSGATLSLQGQTFKVARQRVRRKVRASVEPEASCEDAFGDLCRSAPPRGSGGLTPESSVGLLGFI